MIESLGAVGFFAGFPNSLINRVNYTYGMIFDTGTLVVASAGALRYGRMTRGGLWMFIYHQVLYYSSQWYLSLKNIFYVRGSYGSWQSRQPTCFPSCVLSSLRRKQIEYLSVLWFKVFLWLNLNCTFRINFPINYIWCLSCQRPWIWYEFVFTVTIIFIQHSMQISMVPSGKSDSYLRCLIL